MNVLWCRSHLVRLVFERSIPTCACFPLENFFGLVIDRTEVFDGVAWVGGELVGY